MNNSFFTIKKVIALVLLTEVMMGCSSYALKRTHSQAYESDEDNQPPRKRQRGNQAGDVTSGVYRDDVQEEASASSSTRSSEGLAPLSAGDVFVLLPNEEVVRQALTSLFPAVCLSFGGESLLQDQIVSLTSDNQLAILHTRTIDDFGAQVVEEYPYNQDVRKHICDGLHVLVSSLIMRLAGEGRALNRALAQRYAREMVAGHDISIRLIFALLADYLQSSFFKLVAWNSFTPEEKETYFANVDEPQEHPSAEEPLPVVVEQQTGIRGFFRSLIDRMQMVFGKIRGRDALPTTAQDNVHSVSASEPDAGAGKLDDPFYRWEKSLEAGKACSFTQSEQEEHLLDPKKYAVTRTGNPSIDLALAIELCELTGSFQDMLTEEQIEVLQFLAKSSGLDFKKSLNEQVVRVVKAQYLEIDCSEFFKKSDSFRNCFFELLNNLFNCSHLILRGRDVFYSLQESRQLVNLLERLSANANLKRLTLRGIDIQQPSHQFSAIILQALSRLNIEHLTFDSCNIGNLLLLSNTFKEEIEGIRFSEKLTTVGFPRNGLNILHMEHCRQSLFSLLVKIPNLQALSFSGNYLPHGRGACQVLEGLAQLPHLEDFTCNGEFLMGASQEEVRSIVERLHRLHLTQLKLDIHLKYLCEQSDSELRDIFETLRHLPSLTTINFRGSFIDPWVSPEQALRFTQVLEGLKTLPHLTRINVRHSVLVAERFELLRAALPHLEVVEAEGTI